MTYSIIDVRKDFPILSRTVHDKNLVYLDNAATTQKPQAVIDSIVDYYSRYNSNIHRSIHTLGEQATTAYENAHRLVSDFIGAKFEEVIFTKGSTESLNLLAYSLGSSLEKGDKIFVSELEHHSNLVTWQELARKNGFIINYIPITKAGLIDVNWLAENIDASVKIISVAHVSNVFGSINDIEKIEKIAHSINSCLLIVDAAQSVPHMKIDVTKLNVDFLVFSGHKILAPTGIGVLYGKQELLEKMTPFHYGGEMISEVSYSDVSFNELPWRFEAGTPNISGGIAFGEAIKYIQSVGIENIESYVSGLVSYAYDELSKIDGVTILGPDKELRSGLISFTMDSAHPHDIAHLLDCEGIAVRAGYHCAMPVAEKYDFGPSVRASFYVYNTRNDVDRFIEAVKKVKTVFG